MRSARVEVRRYAAFTEDPDGGNPAGVVLDASRLDERQMQEIAAAVGYSETAFVTGGDADAGYRVRYFTPEVEVPFCGHATIATAVALGEGGGAMSVAFETRAGRVPIEVSSSGGTVTATLRSVPPTSEPIARAELEVLLAELDWSSAELDARLAPCIADAGARHLLLAVSSRQRLASLDVEADAWLEVSERFDLVTIAVLFRADEATFHARNVAPAVGIPEDPATGAAAAALGGHLAELGAIGLPGRFVVLQGEDMGRPSRLEVRVTAPGEPVEVTGAAVPIRIH